MSEESDKDQAKSSSEDDAKKSDPPPPASEKVKGEEKDPLAEAKAEAA